MGKTRSRGHAGHGYVQGGNVRTIYTAGEHTVGALLVTLGLVLLLFAGELFIAYGPVQNLGEPWQGFAWTLRIALQPLFAADLPAQ